MDSIKYRYRKSVCGVTILCEVIPMGKDFTICVWDDRGGHVGSAVMSVARPSLTGHGTSTTTSVLNRPGHKDEEVARHLAETVAACMDCAVVCTCGIHLDGITPEQIRDILKACRELEEEIVEDLQKDHM
ncbi:MAG: hypothetical protein LIP12_05485 [Clostridiales bacterium]|nr:hypothetical protein [Clostridiales bacterium]MCC8065639.1 hypothetical protein [Clostridiales bacterium]